MSEFTCDVVKLVIEPHPNADAIEICRIGDYQSIVKKGQFKSGDLGVYIPEQAVLPVELLKEMGFWDEVRGKGMLHGGAGNRVKAIKLRGVLSQGLIYPVREGGVLTRPALSSDRDGFIENEDGTISFAIVESEDVSEILGIVKYESAIPSHMRGRIIGADYENTHAYDFDNIKKLTNLFEDGEPVIITEKIHGTFLQVGVLPTSRSNEKYYEERVLISSKGMGAKGFVLDHNDETNIYAQAAKKHGLLDAVLKHLGPLADATDKPVFLCGEVFGKTGSGAGVQDLIYTGETLDFRAFDIAVGNRGNESYFDWFSFYDACAKMNVRTAPVLHNGPYSKSVVLELTDGHTTLCNSGQIREGVVVKSSKEDRHPHYGRKIAKSISEAYLMRKNGTELN